MPKFNPEKFDRRTFIKSSAIGAGVVGLAGCAEDDPETGNGNGNGNGMGDDDTGNGDGNGEDEATPDGDAVEMVMVTSDSATASYASSQGLAAVVNEHSDNIFLDARPSGGTDENAGLLNRGEAQIGMSQGWSAGKMVREEEPFDDLDFTPTQTFHLYDLPWVFATANDGWESIMDIEPDSRVNPTPAGSGTAPPLELALEEHAGLEYDRVSFGFGEMAGAMNEGRLDAGAVTLMNSEIEAGWLQEMKGTVDLRILDTPDDVVQAWEDDERLLAQDVDMTIFDGYAYTPDTATAITLTYNFLAPLELDYDAVYELVDILLEHHEELGQYHAVLGFHAEDLEWFTHEPFPGMPFHPGAADALEEHGLWNDDWERAEQ